jgi:hypothetical protein
MGSFRDQYEQNFGPLDPYDPIDVGPFGTPKPRRSALPTSPEEAMAGPTPLYEADLDLKRTPKESGFLENVGRQFAAGTVQVGEMGLGAAEYVARNNSLLDGIVADTIHSGRSRLAQTREDILAGISEADRQKAAAEILTLDPNRTIWQGNPLDVAEAIIYKTANALPATLVTMIPAIRFARAATPGKAIAAMGATEGTMSVGGIQNGIADEILGMTTEELVNESPMFNQILQRNGGNVDEARRELITEAQGLAPLVGGATVAAISSVAGRYFTPIFEKGGGAALGSRVGRGFAAEAPQEASQGASEQLVQNYAAKIYDLDRQLSEGVAEAAAQEGMLGGIMGGGFAGALGQRPTPERPPGPEIDPNARPEITDQPDLPGFEPGGRLPDELDQPMPEPAMDIDAQIQDLLDPESRREGVYLAPGTDERLVASLAETLPDELTFVRNVDGEGGHMITRSAELGLRAQEAIANGASRQEVIGRITAIGRGKPTNPDSRVVQLLDANGAVARESMVGSQQEAEALGVAWSKEKENKGLRVAVLSPREALERRQILGQEGEFGIQEDMFDNTAARGTDAELVKPAPLEDPIQQQLPLTNQRERGVGRTLEDVDRPTTLPDDTIEDEEGAVTDPYEISRRQYGMDFEDPGVETVTTRNKSTRRTGRFLVRMYDDEGNVIHEEAKNSVVGAETTSEALAKDFPDANIQVVPETEADVEVKTRAKKRQTKPIEPVYEQSIEEEVQGDIRANVPFEERDEPLAAVKGSRSYGQAADKLLGASAAEFEAEERGRIGGFYNPDTLTFDNPEYESDYRETWEQLLDEEIRFEMTGTKTKARQAEAEDSQE